MSSDRQTRLLQIVILVVLAATLFNTVQTNRALIGTTEFRFETRRQLAAARQELDEQKAVNAELRRQLDRLAAAQEAAHETQSAAE
jgi:hypothetical protein